MTEYKLKIDTLESHYQILVNGFPIFMDYEGHPSRFKIPINQYLKNGENTINVFAISSNGLPFKGSARCKIDVLEGEKLLLNLSTPNFTEGMPMSNLKMEGSFFMYIKQETYLFFESPAFEKKYETYEKIKDFYTYMWEVVKDKDINMLMALTLKRDTDIANAYGTALQARVDDVKPFYQKIMNHPEMTLMDLDFRKYKLAFYCENRVVCLEDEKGEQPIVFEDKDATMEARLPFYVCQNPKKELLIIR